LRGDEILFRSEEQSSGSEPKQNKNAFFAKRTKADPSSKCIFVRKMDSGMCRMAIIFALYQRHNRKYNGIMAIKIPGQPKRETNIDLADFQATGFRKDQTIIRCI